MACAAGPLIAPARDRRPDPPATLLAGLAIIVMLTLGVFSRTLQNGFLQLGFDDALILDTPALHALSWVNLRALCTEFNHAHYAPLTMLSLALDYHFWGLEPFGYHLTNVCLHAAAASLAYLFVLPILGSARRAVMATLIFALHPIQMEAVSIAVQRKTLLSGALFFLTFILYRRWLHGRRQGAYVGSVLAFAAAVLAKPAVVTLPLLLLLYDYVFSNGRVRLLDKLPFVAIAAIGTLLTMLAHAAVGATHGPHGGTQLANALMVSRVLVEYFVAMLLPLALSPIYYYPAAGVLTPLNGLALLLVLATGVVATRCRARHPWSFFCLWWCLFVLLPESNLIPIAQLRADRFLYLAMIGFGIWVVIGVDRLADVQWHAAHARTIARWLTPSVVGVLAVMCYTSAAVWRDEVSAWRRVVERHPWCAIAHAMLGRASYGQDDPTGAERELTAALRLSPGLPTAHLYLAKVFADRGQAELAQAEVDRMLELSPNDPEAMDLRAALRAASGS